MSGKKYSRVYVEITNICNRSCSFCPGTKREPKRMTMEEFLHIAKELRDVTDYLYFHVMGEPLTHPLLPDLIEYATSLGYKCAITTNGTLIDKCGEQIIKAGAYKINLSIHSFEEGREENYISYIKSLADFAYRASSQGTLTVLRLWNKGHDGGRNERTLKILEDTLAGEWKWGARGARIRHKLHLEFGERFEWPDKEAPRGTDEVFCYGLLDHFGILVDGSVVPCCLDREGVITLGNIYKEPIEQILSSGRAEKMKSGFLKRYAAEDLCTRCGYARRF